MLVAMLVSVVFIGVVVNKIYKITTYPLNVRALTICLNKAASVHFKWVLNLKNPNLFNSRENVAHHQSKQWLQSFTFYQNIIADAFPQSTEEGL